ncbi:hypothetical protein VTI74DRAFT_10879 [Chaetomium olivicolor]
MASLYAELLANIRQISLAASLPSHSPADSSTQVTLASDCKTVVLSHRGNTQRLTLPAKASLGGTLLPIQQKQKGSSTLSWRLPLDASSLPQSHQSDTIPWSAIDLTSSSAATGVTCRQCNAGIVPPEVVREWKDLPSENWAEMMEFWHCHKPDHHHHNHHDHGENGKADENSLAARGYGASSAISAQEGVGFVDLTTLLFAEADCRNVTFSLSTYEQGSPNRHTLPSTPTQPHNLNVFCTPCHAHLGFFNFRTSAVTLLKWQISCPSTSGVVPSIPECLAATLISTMARSGSSKSLIMPIAETILGSSDEQSAIHIWVLNSSIVYASSSSSGDARPTPAVKLLYRRITNEEADKMLEAVSCDSQEINLPAQALDEVLLRLDESNVLLPPTERMFKGWKVGLLTRWEGKA